MSEVVVLRDPIRYDPFSKINNFTYEWIKWYPHIKMAPLDYKFNETDIIIVNICDATNPYSGYDIHPKCKKIGIIHKLDENTIKYLNDFSFIIYLSPILESIAKIAGIQRRSFTCPRYPMYDFNGITLNKTDQAFFGGWIDEVGVSNITSHLLECDSKISKTSTFYISYTAGLTDSIYTSIQTVVNDIRKSNILPQRTIYTLNTRHSVPMLLFYARISKYGCLSSTLPSIEEFNDHISSKNIDILKYSIGESSMLSIFQSSGCDIICNNNIDFIAFHNKIDTYTFANFSTVIADILKKD